MKRIICLALALAMLLCLAACNKTEAEPRETEAQKQEEQQTTGKRVEGDLREIYEKVNEAVDIESDVLGAATLAEDGEYRDNLVIQYEIGEPEAELYPDEFNEAYVEAANKLTDYIVTVPKNKCTTFVVLRFDNGLPSEEAIKDIKDRVKAYCDKTAAGISLYDQPEAERMTWAIENQDKVWRQYDNALVFIFAGSDNTEAAFEAFEAAAVK